MKEEKIKKLFEKYHSTCYDAMEARHVKVLLPDDFTQAINQAELEIELEWYKKLEKRLRNIIYISADLNDYLFEIKNKIKELENDK